MSGRNIELRLQTRTTTPGHNPDAEWNLNQLSKSTAACRESPPICGVQKACRIQNDFGRQQVHGIALLLNFNFRINLEIQVPSKLCFLTWQLQLFLLNDVLWVWDFGLNRLSSCLAAVSCFGKVKSVLCVTSIIRTTIVLRSPDTRKSFILNILLVYFSTYEYADNGSQLLQWILPYY